MLHIYPIDGVFYLPQHRTMNTRHPLALRHMRLIKWPERDSNEYVEY